MCCTIVILVCIMLVVVVLSCVLADSLLLSLPIEPTTLHGDRSGITMAAGIHLQSPESFNFQTPNEWPRWRKRFEQFRIASGLGSKSEDQQINTLLYCLGEESDDVLTSTWGYRRGEKELQRRPWQI